MSKLEPRPNHNKPLHSWDYLNQLLQSNLSHSDSEKRLAVIDLRDFEMSKDEIVSESTKQGYKVSEEGEHHLRFV